MILKFYQKSLQILFDLVLLLIQLSMLRLDGDGLEADDCEHFINRLPKTE